MAVKRRDFLAAAASAVAAAALEHKTSAQSASAPGKRHPIGEFILDRPTTACACCTNVVRVERCGAAYRRRWRNPQYSCARAPHRPISSPTASTAPSCCSIVRNHGAVAQYLDVFNERMAL